MDYLKIRGSADFFFMDFSRYYRCNLLYQVEKKPKNNSPQKETLVNPKHLVYNMTYQQERKVEAKRRPCFYLICQRQNQQVSGGRKVERFWSEKRTYQQEKKVKFIHK